MERPIALSANSPAIAGRCTGSLPDIRYRPADMAMPSFEAEVHALLRAGSVRICDVGGGANPVIALDDVERLGLDYAILDASTDELAKSLPGYRALVGDINDRDAVARLTAEFGRFDLVISRWTAEHVPQGRGFHQHIHRLLRPGGSAVHLFPTLYSPVFLANRVLPHSLCALVVPYLDRSGRERGGTHEVFPPYYSWCRGPTRRQLSRLASVGFAVRRYIGFFGHPYYARLKPINALHEKLSEWLLSHPLPSLTSYSLIVLERTDGAWQ